MELMSEQINELALALSKAQATIENVSKDKTVKDYSGNCKYKYADLATCLEAIKKPFSDNDLTISQLITVDGEKQMLITMLIHKSGQWLRSIMNIESLIVKNKSGQDTMNSPQQFGAGLTYVRRYALAAIVGLAQEDDDAQSLSKKPRVEDKEKDLSVVRSFMALCREHNIEAREFAKFSNIDSNDLDSVAHGVANFLTLKERFLNAANSNTH